MKNLKIGTLIVALALPLLVGMLSAFLSREGMAAYAEMNKPPLSPPAWVFSVAWTILYLLMGLASYYVMISFGDSINRNISLILYLIQLLMNFMWSIIFFKWEMYLLAFIWLAIMLCLVIACMIKFYALSKTAMVLLIPYAVWLVFAGYLNMGAYILRNTAHLI